MIAATRQISARPQNAAPLRAPSTGIRPTMRSAAIAPVRCASMRSAEPVAQLPETLEPSCTEQQEVAPAPRSNRAVQATAALTTVLMPLAFSVQSVMAAQGEYGLLEGRTAALVHPAMMFSLLASSGYAAYLGWQWRRTREIGEEIREMRKQQPAMAGGTDEGMAPPPNPALVAKEAERKALIAGNYKDRHSTMGSLLLAAGTGLAIEGCVNTYMRTGKLFPGPHLFAGATIVALWAMAASLVPEMQKGNNTARTAHIAFNVANICLFLSQVPSGLEIVDKVFQFTVVSRMASALEDSGAG